MLPKLTMKVIIMKRIVLGGMVFVAGFFGILALGIVSVYNPVVFNGISGIYGFLLDSDLTFLFVISCILCVVGLVISTVEAYSKK